MSKIEKVYIKPGCIACKNCENICPSIFKVKGQSKVIGNEYQKNFEKLLQARDMCPVNVIAVEGKNSQDIIIENKKTILIEKKEIAKDTIELKMKGALENFKSGQYIGLIMKDKKGKFTRFYSVAEIGDNYFVLTIKILKGGRGSSFITSLNKDSVLEYIGPTGDFILKENNKNKVFIGTGTGLAPLYNMIKNCSDETKKKLIYGARDENEFYYLDKLKDIKNLEIINTASKPSRSYNGNKGRVTNFLEDIKKDDEVYICGNPNMVKSVEKILNEKGVKNIYKEEFVVSNKGLLDSIIMKGNIKGLGVLNYLLIIIGLSTPLLIRFGPNFYYEISWIIAWWSLFFVIIIRPLADIFPKILLLRRLIVLRKGLGVLSGGIVIGHLILTAYVHNINFGKSYIQFIIDYFKYSNWKGFSLIARLSELSAIILTLTSNNFSQKLLGVYWKKIQKLSYLYFVTGGIYIASFGTTYAYYMIGIGVLLIIIAFLKNRFRK